MLSRVADSLYWMTRYLERAEHTARLYDVNADAILEHGEATASERWARMLESLRMTVPEGELNDDNVMNHIAFDSGNGNSIITCLTSARENSRYIRELISSEMWEQLNRLYWHIRDCANRSIDSGERHEFLQSIKQGSHLFQGITDSTMSHGEGWEFAQVGRYLERIGATAHLLDLQYRDVPANDDDLLSVGEYLEWVTVLKSCTAFESYSKVYTADLSRRRIAEFLLLNEHFPRSVRHCVDQMDAGLNRIAEHTGTERARRLGRLGGRLRAMLDFAQIDEVVQIGLCEFLREIQKQCAAIHDELYNAYIAYPIDQELAS